MPSAINPALPVTGNPTTESVRDNFAAAKSEIEVLQLTAGVGPQGPPGNTGPAGTVDIGTTTTGIAGSNATVTAAGTPQARILNFTVPRGDTGAGGGGITETQAVNAVRQGQVRFEEATIVNAPAFPTTPNIATTAPEAAAGWALGGDPVLGPWQHTSGAGTLAWPISIIPGELYQIVFTITTTTANNANFLFGFFFRTGPTVTANQQQIVQGGITSMTLIARAERAFSHLVVVPQSHWVGTFTLTRMVRAVTQNSSAFSIKDQMVTVRTNGDIFVGNGGKAYTGTSVSNECVAFGPGSLGGVTTGQYNTALGRDSLLLTSTGSNNTGLGWRAAASITTQSGNVGVGGFALMNVIGANNTAVGYYTMQYGGLTSNNTAIGNGALTYCVGSDNAVVGALAMNGGNAIGKQSGARNAVVGANAGRYLSGTTIHGGTSDSVFIGYQTRSNADGQINQIVIGANAIGHGSDTITLGNDAITAIHANVTTFSAISDSRVKQNIQPANLDQCLQAVKNLPVSHWKWQSIAGVHPNPEETGFVAEDVEKVFPHAVTKSDEWLTVRDADGKAEMTSVSEIVEPVEEGEQRRVEQRIVEKTQEFKGLQRVAMNEALPTLWGAVQKLIQEIEQLKQK